MLHCDVKEEVVSFILLVTVSFDTIGCTEATDFGQS